MVKRNGQAVTEFILMLAVLTAIGILIMNAMIGSKGQGGAVNTMTRNAADKISNDQ